MTKRRDTVSFQHGTTKAAAILGWAACADVTGKSERAVRAWSDPDLDRTPCIDDALALDAACLKAGAGEPPFLAAYQAMLDRMVQPPAESADLARTTAHVAKEAGEAVAALVAASMPGAPLRDRAIAEREVSEAVEALHDAQRKLGHVADVLPIRGAAA